jgi:hypothetical protein
VPKRELYNFRSTNPEFGEAGFLPYLPLTLINGQHSLATSGLLDTGATVNVLPFSAGVDLGYIWEQQTTAVSLTGNLAEFDARVVMVRGAIGQFERVELVFAWTEAVNVPLILGQVNFFMEFDVCFSRSQLQFEVSPKAK